jgi:3-demethoxyubiquinol 3-hydroxylase
MLDSFIGEFDKGLRAIFGVAMANRPRPGVDLAEAALTPAERRHAAALMRVNHCGEVCAQALYQGQALAARELEVRTALQGAAREETDHLDWCASRIDELGGRLSALNPIWYSGSLAIGLVAGSLGSGWNFGFLAETERQVEAHLAGHLSRLPEQDQRTRVIVEQMKLDEAGHAQLAASHGARELPLPAKAAMRVASKVMTVASYWL